MIGIPSEHTIMAKFDFTMWDAFEGHTESASALTTTEARDTTSQQLLSYKGYPFAKEFVAKFESGKDSAKYKQTLVMYSVSRTISAEQVRHRLPMWTQAWQTAILQGTVNPAHKPKFRKDVPHQSIQSALTNDPFGDFDLPDGFPWWEKDPTDSTSQTLSSSGKLIQQAQHNMRVAVLSNTDKITDSVNSKLKLDEKVAKYYQSKGIPHDQWLTRERGITLAAFEKILLKHASETTPAEGPLRHIYTKPRPDGMPCDMYYKACMRQRDLCLELEPSFKLKPKNFLGLWDAYLAPVERSRMQQWLTKHKPKIPILTEKEDLHKTLPPNVLSKMVTGIEIHFQQCQPWPL